MSGGSGYMRWEAGGIVEAHMPCAWSTKQDLTPAFPRLPTAWFTKQDLTPASGLPAFPS